MILLAVSLVLGAAAARTSVFVEIGPDGVRVEAETDDIPRLDDRNDTRPPPPPPPRDTFAIDVRPPSQNATPGSSATYAVHLYAARNVTLHLGLENVTRGYRAELGADTVALRAGTNATVRLVMYAPQNATCEPSIDMTCWTSPRGYATVSAVARDTGETHRDVAELVVTSPPPPPPPEPANLTLAVWPPVQNATPGDTLSYRVIVNSTQDREVHLNVTHLTPGYRATLDDPVVRAGPNGGGWTTLRVYVSSNATSDGRVDLVAWTYEGERAAASAYVRLYEVSTTEPAPPPGNETKGTTTRAPPAQAPAPIEKEWDLAMPLPWGGEARASGAARAAIPMS